MKSTRPPLLLLVLFLLAFPFFLRKRPRVVRRIVVGAAPSDVFPLINDLRNWPRWTAWSRKENIHFTYDGPPSGVGSIQQWETARLNGAVQITQSLPAERIAYTVKMAGGKYTMDGVIALEPVMTGTRITWVCTWDPPVNPYRRYFDLFCMAMVGRDFSSGLKNLAQLVGPVRA